MRVLNTNYFDDKRNPISKEEFERKYAEFVRAYENEYEKIVRFVVEKINNKCRTNREKLVMLFDYLTNSDMKYDLARVSSDGKRACHLGYQFPPYGDGWRIDQGTKYPAILNHSGVCGSYSKTFKDICNKLNIPCKIVDGDTGMDHAWNVVLEIGELKHIDIAYAIMNRNRKNKMGYFMKLFSKLQHVCGNKTMNQNESELIEELSLESVVTNRTNEQTIVSTRKRR